MKNCQGMFRKGCATEVILVLLGKNIGKGRAGVCEGGGGGGGGGGGEE